VESRAQHGAQHARSTVCLEQDSMLGAAACEHSNRGAVQHASTVYIIVEQHRAQHASTAIVEQHSMNGAQYASTAIVEQHSKHGHNREAEHHEWSSTATLEQHSMNGAQHTWNTACMEDRTGQSMHEVHGTDHTSRQKCNRVHMLGTGCTGTLYRYTRAHAG
jgi:hypothetical protein